ncbi:MAG: PAS domain S-box protein [Candidatus Omnitrophica bacterium]|nr:PAS domain S-box protein [Candidatus Omnitrophota bacterium]
MNEALLVVKPDTTISFVNNASLLMLGYTEEELIGKPLRGIVKEWESSFLHAWFNNLNIARFINGIEETYIAKDGKNIPVLFAGSTMVDAQGEIEGVICVGQDITDRKRSEVDLRRAKDDLEIKVKERTAELQTSNQQLERELTERKKTQLALQEAYTKLKEAQFQLVQLAKMEVVGRLASGVAHEVKNPLAIVMQGVEYLLKKIPRDDPQLVTALTSIKEAVERADTVVRGLLDFSAMQRLTIEQADLNSIIEKSLVLLKHMSDKYKIEVSKELKEDFPLLPLDKNKISQVLVNLFMNAIEAMPEGGALTIRTYLHTLKEFKPGIGRRWEDVFNLGETVAVAEIEDTGPGIQQELLSKIFEPFFTTRLRKGGTGLGLSIVKNIIEMHQGIVEIQNKEDPALGLKVMLLFKIQRKDGSDGEKEDSLYR